MRKAIGDFGLRLSQQCLLLNVIWSAQGYIVVLKPIVLLFVGIVLALFCIYRVIEADGSFLWFIGFACGLILSGVGMFFLLLVMYGLGNSAAESVVKIHRNNSYKYTAGPQQQQWFWRNGWLFGNRTRAISNLLLEKASLPSNSDERKPRYQGISCRDVYDDPFRSLPPRARFLWGFLLGCGGFGISLYNGGRWICCRARWWNYLLLCCGVVCYLGGCGLLIFGHAWPPKQECSHDGAYHQTATQRQTT